MFYLNVGCMRDTYLGVKTDRYRFFFFKPSLLVSSSQPVRYFTLSDLLDKPNKPWSQRCLPFPPRYVRAFNYIANRVQHSHFSAVSARRFSSNFATVVVPLSVMIALLAPTIW